MLGKISDISQFCKLEWFEWVMLCDETASFQKDTLRLGCYCGSNIDVDPAMTAKILTQRGQVLHRSMYRLLIPDELSDEEGQGA